MKKYSICIILAIAVLYLSFLAFHIFWKSDYCCRNLNHLTLSELEKKQKKAFSPCCKCKIENFIYAAKNNGDMCRSCCDHECGY